MRGTTASLKNSVVALLCRSGNTVGAAACYQKSLNSVGIIGTQSRRVQVAQLNAKDKVGVVTMDDG